MNKSRIELKYNLTHGFRSVRLTPIKFESQCDVLVPGQWVNTDIQGIERTAQSVYIGRDVISVPIEKLQASIDTNYGQKNRVLTPLEKKAFETNQFAHVELNRNLSATSWTSLSHDSSTVKPFPKKALTLTVCSTILLKTLWEKEKLLVTSIFPFSHSVF